MAADVVLARRGARQRKRSEHQQSSEGQTSGSGAAIAIGALLDGVPESVVLGLSVVGALLLQDASGPTVAVITAIAAGAILAMIADTMIPESFERAGLYTGLITALGFRTAFTLHRLGG